MADGRIKGGMPVVKAFSKTISTETSYDAGSIDVTVSGLKPVAVVGFSHSNSSIYFWKLRINNNSVDYGIAHRASAALTTNMSVWVAYI